MTSPPRSAPPLTTPGRVRVSWRPAWWSRFFALTRFSLRAVCAESAPLGGHDYHTRADDAGGATPDTVGRGRCRRCGKWFRL